MKRVKRQSTGRLCNNIADKGFIFIIYKESLEIINKIPRKKNGQKIEQSYKKWRCQRDYIESLEKFKLKSQCAISAS
jgi:hypothetical protein